MTYSKRKYGDYHTIIIHDNYDGKAHNVPLLKIGTMYRCRKTYYIIIGMEDDDQHWDSPAYITFCIDNDVITNQSPLLVYKYLETTMGEVLFEPEDKDNKDS